MWTLKGVSQQGVHFLRVSAARVGSRKLFWKQTILWSRYRYSPIIGRRSNSKPRGPFMSCRRFSIHVFSRAPETWGIRLSITTSNTVVVVGIGKPQFGLPRTWVR
jgi:hypothetical protein